MQIFIQHRGQQAGPFPLESIRVGLANGIYQLSDLAWYEGASGWRPLSSIPGINENSPPGIGGSFPCPGAVQTSSLAIWSLVLGILALPVAGLTAIPAVICGHMALGRIKQSVGSLAGGGMAIAGLVMGYLGLAIFGLVILAAIGGLTAPLMLRQRKKVDQTEAVNNARSFGLALTEFQIEYGSFPNDLTAAAVAEATGTDKEVGTSSNARFRQLIRAGVIQSEGAFYAHIKNSRKPDGLFVGDKALETGECGFAFVSNVVLDAKVPRPIAMTPLIPGTDRFDPKPFDHKAIILWSDNSVKSYNILQSGHVRVEGVNLMDPKNPVWGGNPPVIAYPE